VPFIPGNGSDLFYSYRDPHGRQINQSNTWGSTKFFSSRM